MNGSFNGVQLGSIVALKTVEDSSGSVQTSFRVLGVRNRELEARLRLGEPATLILASGGVDGIITGFERDEQGYEVTLKGSCTAR
jgi:hypothetical protein